MDRYSVALTKGVVVGHLPERYPETVFTLLAMRRYHPLCSNWSKKILRRSSQYRRCYVRMQYTLFLYHVMKKHFVFLILEAPKNISTPKFPDLYSVPLLPTELVSQAVIRLVCTETRCLIVHISSIIVFVTLYAVWLD